MLGHMNNIPTSLMKPEWIDHMSHLREGQYYQMDGADNDQAIHFGLG